MSEQELATKVLLINYESVLRDISQEIGYDPQAKAFLLNALIGRMWELSNVFGEDGIGIEYDEESEGYTDYE